MAVKCTPVVFITANVGSIFEEPAVMLKIWTREFLSTIARLDPKFVALHCQEVGGKNYEKSMQHVEHFVQLLVDSEELRLFDKVRVFLDEDYSSAENFTALGNFYFVHESIADALIYDFESKTFTDASGKEIYSKNIEHVTSKQKSKFPLQYFPECKWSRKGFLRTRWSLNGVVFDLVNIHLFHDASNFVAIKSFPSVYSDTRRRALAYTLERFQTDEHGSVPFFMFGDFNFRADTKGVVKHLSEGLKCSTMEGEASAIEFKKEDNIVLTLGKKEFSHSDHQTIFSSKEGNWLREFDKELDAFSDQLFEFSISFPPSYPFEENSTGDKCYMKTRCPAWCDRVILSHSAIPLVRDTTGPGNVEYGLMGRSTCMGDHKPVYLKVHIKGSTENETCLEANPTRVLPKPNVQQSASVVASKGSERTDTSSDKAASDKSPRSPGPNYSEIDIDKLACSLEALITRNIGAFPREVLEESIEPDLSRCSTCRTHQHASTVVDNPGGEQVSNGPLRLEDEKLLGLLAYEIKVPESVRRKLNVNDTGQKGGEVSKYFGKLECEKGGSEADRFGAVKRVNSASLVENKPKKEDWKNSRCNSDVSWSPLTAASRQSPEVARIWGINKSFNRGNSRIRLISSSNSLNVSLPRLTSHHSSSDEEWFEEVEESDDDVLEVSCEEISERRKLSAITNGSAEGKTTQAEVNEAGDKPSAPPAPSSDASQSDVTLIESIPELRDEGSNKTEDGTIASGTELDTPSARSLREGEEDGKRRRRPLEGVEPRSSEKKTKTFSILRRLTEGRKDSSQSVLSNGKKAVGGAESRESFENLIVEPNLVVREETEVKAEDFTDLKEGDRVRMKFPEKLINPETFAAETGKTKQMDKCDLLTKDSVESWETIELGEKKLREGNDFSAEVKKSGGKKCNKGANPNCCCTVQ